MRIESDIEGLLESITYAFVELAYQVLFSFSSKAFRLSHKNLLKGAVQECGGDVDLVEFLDREC